MAIVTFQKLVSAYNVPPGTVHHWVWNNAPYHRVWLFSIDPHVTYTSPSYRKARAEVIRVQHFTKLNPPEYEVHVWVKTDPDWHIHYDVYMSTIRA